MLVNNCRSDDGNPDRRASDDVRLDSVKSDWEISDEVGDAVPNDTC